jgi:CRISPR/Cas system-associated exonuclease Cas4 (RecB family)
VLVLTINTISDFYALSETHRVAILKALDTKTRLIDWLDKEARKPKRWHKHSFRGKCRNCNGEGTYLHVPRDARDIHPSQITRCLKKIWFDCSVSGQVDNDGDQVPFYVYSEEYVDPYSQMIFDQGHGLHDQYQSYGNKGAWGKNYVDEVPIDPDSGQLPMAEAYWIRGAVDALLDPYVIQVPGIGPVGIRIIHEYKSINDNNYQNLKSPKPDHKWQASIYSWVFDVPIVVYLYINKDNNKLADFPVPFDFALWSTIEQKIERVQFYVDRRQVPPWEETSAVHKPSECEKCPYLRICNPPQELRKR